MAPEILKRNYSEKCDVWSCGVLLYLLLCGYPPFNASSKELITKKILEEEPIFIGEEWESVSLEAKDYISKLLNKNVEKRPTAEQAIQDIWLKKYNTIKGNEPLIMRALKNLLEFKCDQKLQEFTWMFFVNNFSNNSEEEKKEILQVFQSLDLDGDGSLNKEELIEGYRRLLGKNKEVEEKVEKVLSFLDTNNNGSLDYSEFLIGTIDQKQFLTDKRLRRGFKMFDKVFNIVIIH